MDRNWSFNMSQMQPEDKENILYDAIHSTIVNICAENQLTYAQILGVLKLIENDFVSENNCIAEEGEDYEED